MRRKKMSILEKLKDLVNAIEKEEEPGQPIENVETLTEPPSPTENTPVDAVEEIEPEEEDIQEFPDYLECTLEETTEVLSRLSNLREANLRLGELVSSYEDKKGKALAQISSSRKELLSAIESLRLEYGIPQEGYQVQLPSSPESKVSFSKKE